MNGLVDLMKNKVGGGIILAGSICPKTTEAFEREYDPASGLRFNAWVEGGM